MPFEHFAKRCRTLPIEDFRAENFGGAATRRLGDLRENLDGTGRMNYFAVFFRDRAVFDTRRSIMIDRCEQEQFSIIANQFVAGSALSIAIGARPSQPVLQRCARADASRRA